MDDGLSEFSAELLLLWQGGSEFSAELLLLWQGGSSGALKKGMSAVVTRYQKTGED
jgi:hypothetical protein